MLSAVVFAVFVLTTTVVTCNYSRNGFDYKTKQQRLLSFNTDESGDVSVRTQTEKCSCVR